MHPQTCQNRAAPASAHPYTPSDAAPALTCISSTGTPRPTRSCASARPPPCTARRAGRPGPTGVPRVHEGVREQKARANDRAGGRARRDEKRLSCSLRFQRVGGVILTSPRASTARVACRCRAACVGSGSGKSWVKVLVNGGVPLAEQTPTTHLFASLPPYLYSSTAWYCIAVRS